MPAVLRGTIVNFSVLAGLFWCSIAAGADSVLWGSSSDGSSSGNIYRINAETGAALLVGPSGGDKVSSLAVDPQTGTLYGILGSACDGATLATIDQASGDATPVGIIKGMGFDGTPGRYCSGGADALVFGADGTLYVGGWNGGTRGGKLLTVDKATAKVTRNQPTDIVDGSRYKPADISGLATAPDGTLWVSHGRIEGVLRTIDPETGHFTSELELSDRDAIVAGLAFDPDGTLYGSLYNGRKLASIKTLGKYAGKIRIIGHFGNGVKIAGLEFLGTEVPATDCTADQGGCNPTGGQTIELPQNFSVPAGATITQKRLIITDPRVANGSCGNEPLVLFKEDPQIPDLIIPEYLCGSPQFVVLRTESDLEFEQGTVITTNEPGAFFDDPLPCDSPIVGDPQRQDVMVWQTTDSADIEEGHALELTFECGSSRGRTRGLSWYVVGLHIDFGLDWDTGPQKVRQAFMDLTSVKFHGLLRAIVNARPVLHRRDFNKLFARAAVANLLHQLGLHHLASRQMTVVIRLTERARFAASDFNHGGNVEMRAYNVKFMLDEKVIGLMH